jgi:hypothetical protein
MQIVPVKPLCTATGAGKQAAFAAASVCTKQHNGSAELLI